MTRAKFLIPAAAAVFLVVSSLHTPAQQPAAPAKPAKTKTEKAKRPHAAVDRYNACLADPTAAPERCWAMQQAAYEESHPE